MKTLAMTTAAALALSAAAFAQEQPAQEAPSVQPVAPATVDAGDIPSVDARAAQAGILSENGTPVDPTIPAEIAETPETRRAEASLGEEAALFEARNEFAEADKDGDEQLTREEFVTAMETTVGAEGEAASEEAQAQGEEPAPRSDLDASDYLVAKFAMIAGDDGTLTLEELEDARRTDFADADRNGDEVLEGEEVTEYAQRKAGRDTY
ncbi:EF-hand domain-containing protein [Parvularcula oceani]|uniref:EF-hand domain-containing protein n=1 Tax=Parvularcula oceani TaxID=1247963 RepID=UPI0004E22291|nr:EF-hand domain-containing protein [Parvularcula oceani]